MNDGDAAVGQSPKQSMADLEKKLLSSLGQTPAMVAKVAREVTRSFSQDGEAMIVKLHLEGGLYDRLCASSCVMQLVEMLEVPGLTLVKRDETLLFLFARHARAAVMAGLAVRAICKDVTARYDGCTAQCSIGIGTGPVLLLPGDYYGNSINVASKLGDDTAGPGEFLIEEDAQIEEDLKKRMERAGFRFRKTTVMISGVTIYCMVLDDPGELEIKHLRGAVSVEKFLDREFRATGGLPRSSNLSSNEHGSVLEKMVARQAAPDKVARARLDKAIEGQLTKKGTMYNSDMSGFTRISKKHGILHFLTMIFKMRSIAVPIIQACGGEVLHYDGDNVIALFPTEQQGVDAAFKVQHANREYNDSQDPDSKLLLKIGLASGHCLDTGKQLFGDTWEACELLGEDLGEKREVLMSEAVADAADLAAYEGFIKGSEVRTYDEDEKPDGVGDTYTVVTTKE